eukprot:1893406-Alexandrium_andersonii.AAC.1
MCIRDSHLLDRVEERRKKRKGHRRQPGQDACLVAIRPGRFGRGLPEGLLQGACVQGRNVPLGEGVRRGQELAIAEPVVMCDFVMVHRAQEQRLPEGPQELETTSWPRGRVPF